MKIRFTFLLFFVFIKSVIYSQTGGFGMFTGGTTSATSSATTPIINSKGGLKTVFNGNEAIATSYTATACGLNYAAANFNLNQRNFPNGIGVGAAQPASFTVSGIPTCGKIFKAFLYTSCESGSIAPIISTSIINPLSTNSVFPMTVIGAGNTKCWGGLGFTNSYSYRADITPIISGNGIYSLSGLPVFPGPTDVNGASLFIIYTDESQNYTGSIVIADGIITTPGIPTIQATVSGFSVCGTPTLTTNFMIIDDLQRLDDVDLAFNNTGTNYTVPMGTQLPWMLFNVPGTPAFSGQTSATYGADSFFGSDCIGMIMAGMYYRTGCLTCPSPMTITAASTSSCLSTATVVSVLGGITPHTYTWSGTAQTTSVVTGLTSGTRTITVSDASGCKTGSTTINIAPNTFTFSAPSKSLCIGYSTSLTAGPASSYTWSPGASLNTTSAGTVIANPLITTTYTINATNALGCVGTQTLQLFVSPTQTTPIVNPTTCVNGTINLFANATFPGFLYNWTGPGGFTSSLQNPSIPNATVSMNGAYNLTVVSAPGCTSSAVANVTVFANPSPTLTSNAPICATRTLNLSGLGATTYSWQGPNSFTSALQNPSITNAGTAASGVYTLTGFLATGCSARVTSSITVWPLPTPIISPNSTACIGRPLLLSSNGGTAYAWSGPNAFASTAQNPSITSVVAANAGVYSLTITNINGCQTTATTNVVVSANPTVAATGATVCLGRLATLTSIGTAGGTFLWTGPLGYTNTSQNATVQANLNAMAGFYTVTISGANSCTAQATVSLGILPLPALTAIGSTVCTGNSATLQANGATSYTWTGATPVFSVAAQNATFAVFTGTVLRTYTVVGFAANSCSASATATLSVLLTPIANSAPSTIVCFGTAATITATGAGVGGTYSWFGPNSYTSSAQNAIVPTVTNTAASNYTVIVTAANTCTSADISSLNSKPNPILVVVATPTCLGSIATLSVGSIGNPAAQTFTWAGPNIINPTVPEVNVSPASNPNPVTYSVRVSAANLCTTIATTTLTTIPLPLISATSTLICLNEPFNISASGGTSYAWTPPLGAGSPGGGSTYFIPTVNNLTVGNYTVRGTAATGCTNIAVANINTLALPPIVAIGAAVCIGQPAILTSNGGINGGYSWTGPGGYTSNNQNAFIPQANSPSPVDYIVVGTGVNGCTISAVASLSTFALPLPTYTAPTNGRICFGETIELRADGASTYTWTGPFNYYSPNKNVMIPVFDNRQQGTYTLSVLDSKGCFNFTTTTIIVDPLPDGTLTNDNNVNGCVPYIANFTFNSKSQSPILFFNLEINGKFSTAQQTFSYVVTNTVNSVIILLKDAQECENKITTNIFGYPKPVADFDYLPLKPIEGVDEVKFRNNSTGQALVKWDWFFISNNDDYSSAKNPVYVFDNQGSYPVVMIATNTWGCKDTVIKTVLIDGDIKLYVPNSFSPDGDNLNDVFQPKGLGIKKYDFAIYDRWGQQVFRTSDFSKGWDGSVNGKQSTDDVYIWRIVAVDINGKVKELAGHVNLLR
jgi:gliding motility-associated-like protein